MPEKDSLFQFFREICGLAMDGVKFFKNYVIENKVIRSTKPLCVKKHMKNGQKRPQTIENKGQEI
jgi:hypothetical protein